METQVMTVEEAGKVLGLSRGSAYRSVRRGEIPSLRLGRRLLIPKPALEAMLQDPGAFAEGRKKEATR